MHHAKINYLRTLKQVKLKMFRNAGLKKRICGLRITQILLCILALPLICYVTWEPIFSYVKQKLHHLLQQELKELIKYTKHLA